MKRGSLIRLSVSNIFRFIMKEIDNVQFADNIKSNYRAYEVGYVRVGVWSI